jgi:hypothetical protein
MKIDKTNGNLFEIDGNKTAMASKVGFGYDNHCSRGEHECPRVIMNKDYNWCSDGKYHSEKIQFRADGSLFWNGSLTDEKGEAYKWTLNKDCTIEVKFAGVPHTIKVDNKHFSLILLEPLTNPTVVATIEGIGRKGLCMEILPEQRCRKPTQNQEFKVCSDGSTFSSYMRFNHDGTI